MKLPVEILLDIITEMDLLTFYRCENNKRFDVIYKGRYKESISKQMQQPTPR